MVADGYLVGIPAQIFDDRLCIAKGTFGIYHPIFLEYAIAKWLLILLARVNFCFFVYAQPTNLYYCTYFYSMKNNIPNIITLANLLCGCIAIIFIFEGKLTIAAYLVVAGAIFDFLDGMAARLLQAHSSIGKDLDSLADLITFGLVPGLIIFYIVRLSTENAYLPYVGMLIPLFSALRLAKFNNDPRQSTSFIGLPTPANALFFISIPLIISYDKSFLQPYFMNTIFLVTITIIFSLLLVSEIPLFSLKIKKLSIDQNIFPLILIVMANLLFFTLFFTAIPFIIILYIILSLIKNSLNPNEI
ncbi:MAG: CDP-diacylglycerol--serine O-phosphatidyltransferase [Bacteroidota bacterium]|nr:CDP-diacylglycerol--serine O-phosphatidyltransferase [Bacteroidota bacterium]